MIDQNHAASPATALVTLGAASLGGLYAWLEPSASPRMMASVPSPGEIEAYVKAITNSIFLVVNTLVGCFHAVKFGHAVISHARRRGARRRTPPPTGRSARGRPGQGA